MKIEVKWPLCDGNGVCALEAPDVFALDDDDNLLVLREDIDEALQAQATAAVRLCPKHALALKAD